MPIYSSEEMNLAHVVFAKNQILLKDLRTSAEFCTFKAMKVNLSKAQRDLILLPVEGHMYNQDLQANLVQLSSSIF